MIRATRIQYPIFHIESHWVQQQKETSPTYTLVYPIWCKMISFSLFHLDWVEPITLCFVAFFPTLLHTLRGDPIFSRWLFMHIALGTPHSFTFVHNVGYYFLFFLVYHLVRGPIGELYSLLTIAATSLIPGTFTFFRVWTLTKVGVEPQIINSILHNIFFEHCWICWTWPSLTPMKDVSSRAFGKQSQRLLSGFERSNTSSNIRIE